MVTQALGRGSAPPQPVGPPAGLWEGDGRGQQGSLGSGGAEHRWYPCPGVEGHARSPGRGGGVRTGTSRVAPAPAACCLPPVSVGYVPWFPCTRRSKFGLPCSLMMLQHPRTRGAGGLPRPSPPTDPPASKKPPWLCPCRAPQTFPCRKDPLSLNLAALL